MALRILLPKLILLAILSLSFAFSTAFAADPAKSNSPISVSSEATVVFGGSFSPPTLQHMGLLSYIMNRFKIQKGLMSVALPYKKGAAPAEVSTSLSKIAVRNFDEVLSLNSEPYKNFKVSPEGTEEVTSWQNTEGTTFSLKVDDYDIRTNNKENTLLSLHHYHKTEGGGDAANIFWVSGSDSFASVPTWSAQWTEMFDHANWVVVARPGKDSGGIDMTSKDPLNQVFEKYPAAIDFLKQYTHTYDPHQRLHVYERLDNPSHPKIYIIDKPMLDDSSSMNRKSLAEDEERKHAQEGLQPSVFRECIKKGYYQNDPLHNYFTVENLKRQLEWTLLRTNVDASDRETYEKLVFELVNITEYLSAKNNDSPKAMAAISNTIDDLKENFNMKQFVPKMRKFYATKIKDWGPHFLALYGALELAEWVVVPAVGYHLLGPAGVGLLGVVHQEYISVPSYLAYRFLKKKREQWRLADRSRFWGDKEAYEELTSFRNSLLRGDPEKITSRLKLNDDLGFDPAGVLTNIVKSRMPKWVPYSIRKWDNKKVTWYDLNISTNELRAVVNDEKLFKQLENSANKNTDLLGDLLMAASLNREDRRTRLEVFLNHRYFTRLSFGEAEAGLLSGFTPREQDYLSSVKKFLQQIPSHAISPDQESLMKDVLGDFFTLTQVYKRDPETFLNADTAKIFWTSYIDFMATGYPDRKLSSASQKEKENLVQRLTLLNHMIQKTQNGLFDSKTPFKDMTISYNDKPLMSFSETAKFLDGRLGQIDSQQIEARKRASYRWDFIENFLSQYVTENVAFFKSPKEARKTGPDAVDFLPSFPIDKGVQGNSLIWDLNILRSRFATKSSLLESGYHEALKYIETQPHDPRIQKVFDDALASFWEKSKTLNKDLEVFEYDWLKIRFAHQIEPDETKIPEYNSMLDRYRTLQDQFQGQLDGLTQSNQMLLGRQIVDLQNPDAVRARLGAAFDVDASQFGRELTEKTKIYFTSKLSKVKKSCGAQLSGFSKLLARK